MRRPWPALLVGLVLALSVPGTAAALVTPASTAPPTQKLSLVLPLAANNAGLENFARAVTTPGSPLYGQYQSLAALAKRFGASARARARVVRYLRDHGASGVRIDPTGLFATATLSVTRAQELFGTSLSARREGHAEFTMPATRVEIPRALSGAVTGVVGLNTEPVFTAPQLAAGGAATAAPPAALASQDSASCPTGSGGAGVGGGTSSTNCASSSSSSYNGPDGEPQGCQAGLNTNGFAPNEYLDAYQYAPLQQAKVMGQGERVALVEIDGFKNADINAFANCFGLTVPTIHAIPVGLKHTLAPGAEATLDLEVLDAAAPRLRSIDVYETDADAAHVLQALTAPLRATGFKPDVISVSLGLCESDTLSAVGKAGIATTESALAEAAATGISVLGASGDGGSSGCIGSNGSEATPLAELAVTYPASSPWVTAVGGTNFDLTTQNQILDQVVWNDGSVQPGLAGGGGLSTLFTRPGYQAAVVSPDQRAVPDVALLADVAPGYDVYCTAASVCDGRGWITFGGTSAATPLLAGGFALIDQLLRDNSLQPLGLANPLIYRLALNPPGGTPIVYDVTQGSNDVGPFIQPEGGPLGCCTAATGFDEASGWGGINLAQFAQDVQASQPPLGTATMRVAANQRPLAVHNLAARVHCSRACDVVMRVTISARRRASYTDGSALDHIRSGANLTARVTFTPQQLAAMRSDLRLHLAPHAQIVVDVVDPSGNVESHTATVRLAIPA